jgi:hypothetical protein
MTEDYPVRDFDPIFTRARTPVARGNLRDRHVRVWATACLLAMLAACGGGGSGGDNAATPEPRVAEVASGATVPIGGEIVVVGQDLDAAFNFSIGRVPARVQSQSASRVTLAAPGAATQGALAFDFLTTGGAKATRVTPFEIEVWRPVEVVAFSAPGGPPGTAITVEGVGLENTQYVRIGATETTPTEA